MDAPTVESLKQQLAGVSIAAHGVYQKGHPVPPGYDCTQLHLVADLYSRCTKAERDNEKLRITIEKNGVPPEVIEALRALLGIKAASKDQRNTDRRLARQFLTRWVHATRAAQGQLIVTRNWDCDFRLENGNYANHCVTCNNPFMGHKRRTTCRKCALTDPIVDEV